ncbi:MAG: ThuA domain-containing protein [Ilumatobacteraceae bacterium]
MESGMRVLSMTGGHRVDLDAWLQMLGAICEERGWRHAHSVHPAADRWWDADLRDSFDVVVLHDLPGLFLKRGEAPRPVGPTDEQRRRIRAALDSGIGVVAVHHALAGWPAWDEWADALGGRFLYTGGELHGSALPCSGTTIDTFTVEPVDPSHPVCAGVEPFVLTDERYLCPVFTDDVVPLLRAADAPLGGDAFISTHEHVVVGADEAPRCAADRRASDLLAWASRGAGTPVVYVQPGDTAATFARPEYRSVLANAVAWVSSPEARTWAAERSNH